MTYAVYAFKPLSLRSLSRLLEHQVYGQTARWERFMANVAYVIATGAKLDTKRAEPFSNQIDDIFRNPFEEKKKQPQTAQEIVDYVLGLLPD